MQALVERWACSGVVAAGWRVWMLASQSRWWSALGWRWNSLGPIFEAEDLGVAGVQGFAEGAGGVAGGDVAARRG